MMVRFSPPDDGVHDLDLATHGSSGSRGTADVSPERTLEEAATVQPLIASPVEDLRDSLSVNTRWERVFHLGVYARRSILVMTSAALCVALLGAFATERHGQSSGHMRGFESKDEEDDSHEAQGAVLAEAAPTHDLFDHVAGEIEDKVEEELWEVVNYDWLNVHASPVSAASVIGTKWKCEIIAGLRRSDWVELSFKAGYVRRMLGDTAVLRRIAASYGFVAPGANCSGINMYPITDPSMCGLAAQDLGLAPATVSAALPEGCQRQHDGTWLWEANTTTQQLCSTMSPCTPATTTSSTTSTTWTRTATNTSTTTTSTTWTSTSTATWSFAFPSLFCFSVTRTTGYEPHLIRAQKAKGISIFACEDWAVLTDGGSIKLGSYKTPAIKVKKVAMGDLHNNGVTTTSWLNTMIFMEAWEIIGKDSRFRLHDWTVKVDPDAVFFPHRLKRVVAPISMASKDAAPKDKPKVYINNCDLYRDKGWSMFFGSLEVFSTQAIEAYLWGWKKCEKALKWHGWGEDLFVSSCMEFLGVDHVNEFGMLADHRCYAAPCSDHSKIAFHDFKTIDTYFSCWTNATAPVNFHVREDLKALDRAIVEPAQALKN